MTIDRSRIEAEAQIWFRTIHPGPDGMMWDTGDVIDYRSYLLTTIREVYNKFEYFFSQAWDQDAREENKVVKGYKEYVMRGIFQDTMGYAGCKINRRILGLEHVADIQSIKDEKRRVWVQCWHCRTRSGDYEPFKILKDLLRLFSNLLEKGKNDVCILFNKMGKSEFVSARPNPLAK